MPLKYPPAQVIENFTKIDKTDIVQLKQFLVDNFKPTHDEVKKANPSDWKENPDFLNYILDPTLK